MRRFLYAVVFVCFVVSLSLGQNTTTLSAHIADLGGAAQASKTFLRVELKGDGGQSCRVSGTGIITPYVKDFSPNGTGDISATLYKTSSITCGTSTGNSKYLITTYYNGQPQRQCYLQISSATTLESAACLNATTTPVQAAPTDSVYARLDGTNAGFTGNISHNGHDDTGIGTLGVTTVLAGDGNATQPSLGFSGVSGLGWYRFPASYDMVMATAGLNQILTANGLWRNGSAEVLGWSSSTDPTLATADVNISHVSGGVLQLGTGETGNANGTLALGALSASSYIDQGNTAGTPTSGATNLFNPIMNQGGLVDNGFQGANVFASKFTVGPANPVTNVFAMDAFLWAASGGANSLATGKTTYSAIVSNEYAQTQGQHLVTNTNLISTGKGDAIGYMGTNRCYGGSNTGGDQGCQAFSYFLEQGDFEANDQFGANVASTVDNGTTITINYNSVNAFELRRGELEYVIDTTKAVTTGTFTAVSGTPPAITFSGVNLATALSVTTPITYAAGKEAFCFSPTANDATSGAKWVIPIRTITDSTHLTLNYNVQGADTSWPTEGATSGTYRIYPCGQIIQGGLGTSAITVNKGTSSWTAGDAFEQPLAFDFMGNPGVIVWDQQLPIAPNVLGAGWTIANQSTKMFQSLGGVGITGPWSTGIWYDPYVLGNFGTPSYFLRTSVGAAPSLAMMYVQDNVNNNNVNFLRVTKNSGADATFSYNKSVDRWATPQDWNAVNYWLSSGTAFNSELSVAGQTAARTHTFPDNSGTVAETNLVQDFTAVQNLASNKAQVVTSDFTTTSLTLTAITGLSWTLPAVAKNWSFHCAIAYAQGTAAAADAFGIKASAAPTNIMATGQVQTNTTAFTAATLATLSTTTATNIVSFTPSAPNTNFIAYLDGTIENPASANTIQIMALTGNASDTLFVKRGSYCQLF